MNKEIDIQDVIDGWEEFSYEERKQFFDINLQSLSEIEKPIYLRFMTIIIIKAYECLFRFEEFQNYEFCIKIQAFIYDVILIYKDLIDKYNPTQDEINYLSAINIKIKNNREALREIRNQL